MLIQVLSEKSEDMRAFDKAGWKDYDLEHFGKPIEWDTKLYYLKAVDEKDSIVGTMELKIEGGVGKINTLLIAKSAQRTGIGKSLIQKSEELTKHHNGHKIYVITGKNWEAKKFYDALGFNISAELNNHFYHVDFIELTKVL